MNLEKLPDLLKTLDEAFDITGMMKSRDGFVSLHFGNYHDRMEVSSSLSVEIYAYPFGNGRHYFNSIEKALEVVTEWRDNAVEEEW